MVIDTHCHLNSISFPPFKFLASFSDFDLTPSFITMSTHSKEWCKQVELSQKFNHVYCALGIHPWYAQKMQTIDLLNLEEHLKKNFIIALGEIGLDFNARYKPYKVKQLECLIKQLELAERFSKPVSLHVIKAHNEMLSLLSNVNVSGIIHGLGSSKQIVKSYVDLGFKIGINGIITRINARRYHEMVSYLGLEHIVLETDYPYIDISYSKKPCLSDILLVAQQVAYLLNVSLERVLLKSTQNTQLIFNETFVR